MTIQTEFLDEQLTPVLNAAQAGQGDVYFVDAAHFVYGTFVCCLWFFQRLFVRAASGRQRFSDWLGHAAGADRREDPHT